MAKKEMSVEFTKDECIIHLPLNLKDPRESSTGKSHLVAGTGGWTIVAPKGYTGGETIKLLTNVLRMK
jgi:hypothetical protein